MTKEDKEILTWYFYGFNDSLKGSKNRESDTEINNAAYKVGFMHARLGDDMPTIDYMTDEETLKIIKNEYGKNI
jgi:hypothetical protein